MMDTASKVYAFTGTGKGKTTAAMGLALCCAARGGRAAVVQFLKGGGYTGELFSAPLFGGRFQIFQFGYGCPKGADIKAGTAKCDKCGLCFRENRKPANGFAPQAFSKARELLLNHPPDLLILDEISHAIRHKLIPMEDVAALVQDRPEGVDIVLTGRQMPPELLALTNIATECVPLKHPISKGIDARRGIEY